MPEVPKEALPKSQLFLKPAKLGLKAGDVRVFVITGPHESGQQGLLSLPVKVEGEGVEGLFPLNKTHTAFFVSQLGSNSDNWAGKRFEAIVVPQNNPKTGKITLSWSITRLVS
jgi:hypothetical protein